MSALLVAASLLAAQKDFGSTKEAMRPIQLLVGEWKAQVSPESGEAWEETQKWEYRIEKEVYSLEWAVTDGKKFKGGLLSYDLKTKLFRLEAAGVDGRSTVFEGKLAGKDLVLEEPGIADGAVRNRIAFNLLRDNRILVNYERREAGKKAWTGTHQVAATKQGVPFVRATGPKCVVTGGSPQTEVAYKGKTYYVC
jgi:hypothetical protein